MKIKLIFFVVGVVIVTSLLSMHLFNTYYWKYDDPIYQLKIDNHIYDLKSPKQKWELPGELEEISGLSYLRENQLACIQDEEGIFYVYDLDKKEIVRKDRFGKSGDYEGIEVINDTAYVLKSNGEVFYFQLENQGIGEVKKIKTDLTKKNDAEGLGFYRKSKELLIACKEDPGTKNVDLEKSRSIYGIDLATKKFKKIPKFLITGKSYTKMLEKKGLSKKKHKPFKPSDVAVHPDNNSIFVIGTVGKMMVILNSDGEIEDLIPLDPKIFLQPEGICFSPGGDLYISSEGAGSKGYILKF